MQKFKKIMLSVLTVAMVAGCCTVAEPMTGISETPVISEVSAASKVKISKTKLTLNKGKTSTLKISGTSKKVTWSTSNKKVATVNSKGKVTAKKKGTATITAKVGGKKYKCKVTVKAPITSVKLSKSSVTIVKGDTYTLKTTISPSNTTSSKKITWSSSKKSVATVNSKGKVTAKKAGTATITAKTSNGKKATCKVTVKKAVNATSISLSKTSLSLDAGSTSTLKATMKPSNATSTVSWSSSNTSVATVSSSGKVTAKAGGTATITAKTSNGKKATCKVTVNVPITSVSLDSTSVVMSVGNTHTITATVKPSDTTASKTITWSSNKTSVATVSSSGKVTAKAPGSATITATTSNGKTKTCKITVNSHITGVSLNKTSLTLTAGNSSTLSVTISPSDTTDDTTLTWTSSNASVATVSSSGKVTAKSAGTATVTVTSSNGKTATCKVTVNAASSENSSSSGSSSSGSSSSSSSDSSGSSSSSDSSATVTVTGIKLCDSSITMYVGGSYDMTAEITPSNATDQSVTWTSSNTSIATIGSMGMIVAKAAGTTTITGTASNGLTDTCKLTVKEKSEMPTVTFDKTSLTLETDDTKAIWATCSDDSAASYSTSDSSVASIKENTTGGVVVTGKKAGTATITAESGGATATCKVTVKDYSYSATVLPIDYDTRYGYTTILVYVKSDAVNASNPDLDGYWEINGGDISTTTVYVQYDDIEYTDTSTIRAFNPVEGGYISAFQIKGSGNITAKLYRRGTASGSKDVDTGASFTMTLEDYDKAESEYIQSLVDMAREKGNSTDWDIMFSLASYIQETYKYHPRDKETWSTSSVNLMFSTQLAPYWETQEIGCEEATDIMIAIADNIGIEATGVYKSGHEVCQAVIDGTTYTFDACPYSNTNLVDTSTITKIDLSKY